MELEEAFEKVNKIRLNFYDKQYKKSYTDDELTDMCDSLSTILQYIKYDSIPKKKIEDMKNKIHEEYINILSEYGNIDTDITFDIPNKNVIKHLDELMLEIMILQELLEDK